MRGGFRQWNSSSTDCFGSLIRERSLRSFFCASSFCRKRKRGDRVRAPIGHASSGRNPFGRHGSIDHQRVAHFLPRGAATGAKLRPVHESTIRKKGYPCSSEGARLGRSVSESRMLQCGAPNGQNTPNSIKIRLPAGPPSGFARRSDARGSLTGPARGSARSDLGHLSGSSGHRAPYHFGRGEASDRGALVSASPTDCEVIHLQREMQGHGVCRKLIEIRQSFLPLRGYYKGEGR